MIWLLYWSVVVEPGKMKDLHYCEGTYKYCTERLQLTTDPPPDPACVTEKLWAGQDFLTLELCRTKHYLTIWVGAE